MCMKKFDAEKIFFDKQYLGVSSKFYLLPSFIIAVAHALSLQLKVSIVRLVFFIAVG